MSVVPIATNNKKKNAHKELSTKNAVKRFYVTFSFLNRKKTVVWFEDTKFSFDFEKSPIQKIRHNSLN